MRILLDSSKFRALLRDLIRLDSRIFVLGLRIYHIFRNMRLVFLLN